MSNRAFSAMAENSSKLLEGVFAISKPASLSSAQVLRDLQNKFKVSETFQPLLKETERKENESGGNRGKRRRISSDNVFKMGHGGTLDPLATGVLIVGIGRGTKYLSNFLECTKTYDTVVLFGKSTDTFDIAGKVVANAAFKHITKATVDEKLSQFRGNIKQVPPIYSALKINGMKAYEYARSGKELPRELESRNMRVDECQLLEWFDAGHHNCRWPATEAPDEDKVAAHKLMRSIVRTEDTANPPAKAELDAPTNETNKPDAVGSTATQDKLNSLPPSEKAALHTHNLPPLCDTPADAPAARVRLTVSSGFYVRSFAHDLGIACGSFGIMAELARTRQADYCSVEPCPTNSVPCLTYEDLAQGEEVWGPKITNVLEDWMRQNPVAEKTTVDGRDLSSQWRHSRDSNSYSRRTTHQRFKKRSWGDLEDVQDNRRRNSSSPE